MCRRSSREWEEVKGWDSQGRRHIKSAADRCEKIAEMPREEFEAFIEGEAG